jgi:hypothetical protein
MRQAIMLLTCAWVLWKTITGDASINGHTALAFVETKAACQAAVADELAKVRGEPDTSIEATPEILALLPFLGDGQVRTLHHWREGAKPIPITITYRCLPAPLAPDQLQRPLE